MNECSEPDIYKATCSVVWAKFTAATGKIAIVNKVFRRSKLLLRTEISIH